MAPRGPSIVSLPRIVDTSVAIDGRVLDVVRSGFLHGRFLVPQPVLDELQNMADSGDDLRRDASDMHPLQRRLADGSLIRASEFSRQWIRRT